MGLDLTKLTGALETFAKKADENTAQGGNKNGKYLDNDAEVSLFLKDATQAVERGEVASADVNAIFGFEKVSTKQNNADKTEIKQKVTTMLTVLLDRINKGEFDDIKEIVENMYAEISGSADPFTKALVSAIMSKMNDIKEAKSNTDAKFEDFTTLITHAMHKENLSETSRDLFIFYLNDTLSMLKDLPAASNEEITDVIEQVAVQLVKNPSLAQLENNQDTEKLKTLILYLRDEINKQKESVTEDLKNIITNCIVELQSDNDTTENINFLLKNVLSKLDEATENDSIKPILVEILIQMNNIAKTAGVDTPQKDSNSEVKTSKVMTSNGMVVREEYPDGTVYETGLNGVRKQVQ